jgi:hypothetical protein
MIKIDLKKWLSQVDFYRKSRFYLIFVFNPNYLVIISLFFEENT